MLRSLASGRWGEGKAEEAAELWEKIVFTQKKIDWSLWKWSRDDLVLARIVTQDFANLEAALFAGLGPEKKKERVGAICENAKWVSEIDRYGQHGVTAYLDRKFPPEKKKAERKPRPEKIEKPEKAPAPVQDLGEEVDDEKSQAIRKFLTGLLAQMESEATVKVYQPEKGRYKVILEGENLGALIGRRGETLDAIQQLTSYSVNRTGGRVRVQLDAEGYRDKREQSLQHLAKKVAAKVVKYRRSVTLEPMNAYERHVIHAALQDKEGVTTYSIGTEPNRRIVIAYSREG